MVLKITWWYVLRLAVLPPAQEDEYGGSWVLVAVTVPHIPALLSSIASTGYYTSAALLIRAP